MESRIDANAINLLEAKKKARAGQALPRAAPSGGGVFSNPADNRQSTSTANKILPPETIDP